MSDLLALLQELHLQGCSRPAMVDQCCNHLNNLTELTLNRGGIKASDFGIIVEALKSNTTITSLVITCQAKTLSGQIAEIIASNKSIVTLVFTFYALEDDTCIAVSNALKTNTTITELDLSYNRIGNEAAEAIAECLMENSTLQAIDLQSNRIGSSGATAIAESLKVNTSLKKLMLQKNSIGDDGCIAIASALETNHNTALEILYLWNNDFGNEAAIQFASALAKNETITDLSLAPRDDLRTKTYQDIIDVIRTGNACITDFMDFHLIYKLDSVTDAQRKEANYYLNLNKAGRKFMLSGSTATRNEQVEVLVRNQHNMDTLFAFLLLKPDLCEHICEDDDSEPRQRKRKRDNDVVSTAASAF